MRLFGKWKGRKGKAYSDESGSSSSSYDDDSDSSDGFRGRRRKRSRHQKRSCSKKTKRARKSNRHRRRRYNSSSSSSSSPSRAPSSSPSASLGVNDAIFESEEDVYSLSNATTNNSSLLNDAYEHDASTSGYVAGTVAADLSQQSIGAHSEQS